MIGLAVKSVLVEWAITKELQCIYLFTCRVLEQSHNIWPHRLWTTWFHEWHSMNLCNPQLVQMHINTEDISHCNFIKNISLLFLYFPLEYGNALNPFPFTIKSDMLITMNVCNTWIKTIKKKKRSQRKLHPKLSSECVITPKLITIR